MYIETYIFYKIMHIHIYILIHAIDEGLSLGRPPNPAEFEAAASAPARISNVDAKRQHSQSCFYIYY